MKEITFINKHKGEALTTYANIGEFSVGTIKQVDSVNYRVFCLGDSALISDYVGAKNFIIERTNSFINLIKG